MAFISRSRRDTAAANGRGRTATHEKSERLICATPKLAMQYITAAKFIKKQRNLTLEDVSRESGICYREIQRLISEDFKPQFITDSVSIPLRTWIIRNRQVIVDAKRRQS